MLYCPLTGSQLDDLSPLVRCSDAVSLWCHQNALLRNPGKTEAVLFATRQRLVGVDFSHTIKVRCRCRYSVFGGGQAAWRHAGDFFII